MAAILDREHALCVERASPAQRARRGHALRARTVLAPRARCGRERIDRDCTCGCACAGPRRSRSSSASLRLSWPTTGLVRTYLSRGGCQAPIEVTPVVLGRRRATRHSVGQSTGRQTVNGSARRSPKNQLARSDAITKPEDAKADTERQLPTQRPRPRTRHAGRKLGHPQTPPPSDTNCSHEQQRAPQPPRLCARQRPPANAGSRQGPRFARSGTRDHHPTRGGAFSTGAKGCDFEPALTAVAYRSRTMAGGLKASNKPSNKIVKFSLT